MRRILASFALAAAVLVSPGAMRAASAAYGNPSGPPGVTQPSTPSTAPLPYTGGETVSQVLVGVGACSLGVAALLAAALLGRRRRYVGETGPQGPRGPAGFAGN